MRNKREAITTDPIEISDKMYYEQYTKLDNLR